MEDKKTIVFDFDGTIADTFDISVEIYNKKIVPRFKLKRVDKEEVTYLRSKKSQTEILKKYNVPFWKLPFMVISARRELSKRINEIRPQDGIVEVIKDLKNRGYCLGILSSNSKKNINIFLKNYGLSQCFDFIITSKHIFGKHKVMNRISKKQDFVYVGDENRDIQAAKRADVISVAVTWGFNKKDALEKQNPDYIIDKPAQLLDII
jgi:phosphoglycolate phosphatase